MMLERLSDLRCPKHGSADEEMCGGDLGVKDGRSESTNDEILEGFLCCRKCKATYPIIAGVAVLMPNIDTYLSHHLPQILSTLLHYKISLSDNFVSELSENRYAMYNLGSPNTRYDNMSGVSKYLLAHYDDIGSLFDTYLGSEHVLSKFLQSASQENVYKIFQKIPLFENRHPGLGLDVGSSVGGLAYRLSSLSDYVWGIDVIFANVLTARQVLLGIPHRVNRYDFRLEGTATAHREIRISEKFQGEFIVADCHHLPFRNELFDVAFGMNILDMVSKPRHAVGEIVRVLGLEASLVLADPYRWDIDSNDMEDWYCDAHGLSAENLKNELEEHFGMDVYHERDNLTWPLSGYRREVVVYLVHLIAAKKLIHTHSKLVGTRT